jgi:hypothetical protein
LLKTFSLFCPFYFQQKMSKGGALTITDKRTALGERYTELNELSDALPPQVRPLGNKIARPPPAASRRGAGGRLVTQN